MRPRASRQRVRIDEAQAIALLRRQLDQVAPAAVVVANGDDAAVLEGSMTPWVWSIDSSAEGAHFDLRWLDLGTAAQRALHAAVSDLAAMGAAPVAALCALTVPPNAAEQDFSSLARGQRRAARELGCPVIGGNLERGNRWRFVTTVLGKCQNPLTRAGAKPGDELWLIGRVGYAAAGLELLRRDASVDALPASVQRLAQRCIRHWRKPRALIEAGQQLADVRAHAAIDVSDGLASELTHLATAGSVELRLHGAALERLVKPLRPLADALAADAEQWVLHGGEDYALLAAGARTARPPGAAIIGEVGAGAGLALLVGTDVPAKPLSGGYDHLRSGA